MKKTTPLRAIRANCLECVGSAAEVKLCPCTSCTLYMFRFGKNPYIKRSLSEEQKDLARGRLAKAREKLNTNI